MPGYLSNIAAVATPSRSMAPSIKPFVRSRSPIAERDQRLALSDDFWSESSAFDETPSAEPEGPPEPQSLSQPSKTLSAIEPHPPSATTTPHAEQMPPGEPTPAQSVHPSVSEKSLLSEISPPAPSEPDAPTTRPVPTRQSRPAPTDAADTDPLPKKPESPKTNTPWRPEISERPGPTEDIPTPSPEARKQPPSQRRPLNVTTTPHPASPPDFPEPTGTHARPPSEARTLSKRSAPVVSVVERSKGSPPFDAPEPIESRAPSRPSPKIVIDHLSVEVISPPPKPSSHQKEKRAPASSGKRPLSQIGSLSDVSKNLALSLRYR